VKDNGDIVKFLKEKNYIMIDNDLGSGSFGKAVLLKDPFIDELFVAKKYEPEYPEIKQEFFQKFLQEIKILYKLNHRNVVRVFNYYAYENIYTGFILMEYVEGGENIAKYINNYAPWNNTVSPDDIFSQLIDGFRYIEDNNIIHRDIRESNILIDASGTVKIIDFGLGKIFKPIETTEDSLADIINRSGLELLPNEYFTGEYNVRTDMFYLAELFHRLLINSGNSSLFSYQQILDNMMKIKPDDRYESFKEIAEAIGKKDFSMLKITNKDREIYQNFSNAILQHLQAYTSEKRFNYSIDEFKKRIDDLIRKNCFEYYIQNNSDLIETVVLSSYRYIPKKDIALEKTKEFYTWFSSLVSTSQQLVLNNLISKISGVEMVLYVDDDLPF